MVVACLFVMALSACSTPLFDARPDLVRTWEEAWVYLPAAEDGEAPVAAKIESVGGKQSVQQWCGAHVTAHEPYAAAGNGAHRPDSAPRGIGQVVQQHDVVPVAEQLDRGVAADVAAAAGDQHVHGERPATAARRGAQVHRPLIR